MLRKLMFIVLGLTILISNSVFAKVFDKGDEGKIRLVATNDGDGG